MSDVDKIKERLWDMRAELSKPGSVIEIVSGWHPMDTAPKDGTRILIWDGGCEIVSWRHGCKGQGGAWWRTTSGTSYDPKFWAPLPKPPEKSK